MLVQLNDRRLGPLRGVYADLASVEQNAIDAATSIINGLLCRAEIKYPGNVPTYYTHVVRVDGDKWILERLK